MSKPRNPSDVISTQTIRIMRDAINDASQFSDDDLMSCGIIMGSFYAMTGEVPGFLPMKEQVTFFSNLVSCFIIPELINHGLIDPKVAKTYIDQKVAAGASMLPDIQNDAQDEDDSIAVIGGGKAVN